MTFRSGGGGSGGRGGQLRWPAAELAEAAGGGTGTAAPPVCADVTTASMISMLRRPSANEAFGGSGSGVPAIWSKNARA